MRISRTALSCLLRLKDYGPILPERLSALVEPLGSHRTASESDTAIPYSTVPSRSPVGSGLAAYGAGSSSPPSLSRSRSTRWRVPPQSSSAPTLALSRPSQCSLTLRPARSADPLRGLSIEVLQIIRRLLIRSDRFRLEREFAGPDFHRGERCALPRHTEQSGREFASTDTTARA